MESIPAREIARRIESFQNILSVKKLDGAFVLQNVDIYYFSGTIQSSILFIPAQGKPILMVLKNIERAESESGIRDIVPIAGRPYIFNVLKDFGHTKLETVGLEMDVLPAGLYLWFKKKMDSCTCSTN